MTVETVAPFLAGPASAVMVSFIVLAALYQLTTRQLLPMLSKALTRHLDALDKLVQTNQADHREIITCLNRIETRIGGQNE